MGILEPLDSPGADIEAIVRKDDDDHFFPPLPRALAPSVAEKVALIGD